jgi:choice-of-anchor C domain-containing protein
MLIIGIRIAQWRQKLPVESTSIDFGEASVKIRWSVAAVATALFLAAPPAQANLISNGTFNSTCTRTDYCTYSAGDSTDIPGWMVTQGSVDLITGYWQAPPGGGNSVDLDGLFQAGGLAQTNFATVNGQDYRVSFYLSGNPDGGNPLKQLMVDVDGTIRNFSYNTASKHNSQSNMKWVLVSFDFIANATSSTLTFTSQDAATSAYGAVIGDVVVDVPEPATLGLLGLGLFAAGFFGRRKMRQFS